MALFTHGLTAVDIRVLPPHRLTDREHAKLMFTAITLRNRWAQRPVRRVAPSAQRMAIGTDRLEPDGERTQGGA